MCLLSVYCVYVVCMFSSACTAALKGAEGISSTNNQYNCCYYDGSPADSPHELSRDVWAQDATRNIQLYQIADNNTV
jgi:hypothetical protein